MVCHTSKNSHSDQQGIALLITLTVIAALVALGLEFNRQMRSLVTSTSSERDFVTLYSMASSGVHGAMAMLAKDKRDSQIDSVQEEWSNPGKLAALMMEMSFDQGEVQVEIFDELSRIQVNALVKPPYGQEYDVLQRKLWYQFLSLYDLSHYGNDDIHPVAIVDSIKDWIDSEDDEAITGLNGAESDYYRRLDFPYTCSNDYISDVSELIRIKGILPALYYGTSQMSGIAEFVTVFGAVDYPESSILFPGRININTAGTMVLKALLPSEYEKQADLLVAYRLEQSGGNFKHNLNNSDWYKNVPGFDNAVINSRLITTSTDFFRIESTAVLEDSFLSVIAVVKRKMNRETGKYGCKILNWKIK